MSQTLASHCRRGTIWLLVFSTGPHITKDNRATMEEGHCRPHITEEEEDRKRRRRSFHVSYCKTRRGEEGGNSRQQLDFLSQMETIPSLFAGQANLVSFLCSLAKEDSPVSSTLPLFHRRRGRRGRNDSNSY
ncbi:hypothetical protein MRB53_019814 [Persea americana]|uniref:Uncharacterized protein n=1 Tax=Persea americana TaxID=3435 RepID=A0ACC2L091_PERAE|nr:hypothetical protein MRB53_019814 [Persea americana]